jgi:arginine exporter protein ArgO
MQGLLDGLIAGYGIAIPVGAVSILIVTTGMVSGFRKGFAAGAGAATADLIYATAASAAGTALVVLLQPVANHFRIAGGAALLLIAGFGIVQGLRKKRGDPKKGEQPLRSAGAFALYAQLLGITLVNPLTVVYFAALVLGRERGGEMHVVDRLAFVLGAAAASLSWQTLLGGIGSFFHGRLPPRFRVGAVAVGNIIVAALGVRILMRALC